MQSTHLILKLLLLASCSIASSATGQDPTISLKAVRVNGSSIARTNRVVVNPGDVVVAEIFIRDWSPHHLHAYRAAIDRISFVSGSRGTVLPLGWDMPILPVDCSTDANCSSEYPNCGTAGVCVGPNHDPSLGVFTDCTRSDWVFYPALYLPYPCGDKWLPPLIVDRTAILYSNLALPASDAPKYTDPEKYAGSLILKVSDDACGQFRLPFNPTGTKLHDQDNVLITPLSLEGLVIETAAPPCKIVESDPPSCAIDPRQPIHPDGSEVAGWNTFQLTFESDVSQTVAEDFGLCGPDTLSFITIQEVNLPSQRGKTVTVRLSENVPVNQWTCVCYLPNGEQICVAALPGDVDGNGASDLQDLSALIDCLGAAESCETWRCDVNHTGRCTPADLLREIDILSGTGPFDWAPGLPLPPCPSTP